MRSARLVESSNLFLCELSIFAFLVSHTLVTYDLWIKTTIQTPTTQTECTYSKMPLKRKTLNKMSHFSLGSLHLFARSYHFYFVTQKFNCVSIKITFVFNYSPSSRQRTAHIILLFSVGKRVKTSPDSVAKLFRTFVAFPSGLFQVFTFLFGGSTWTDCCSAGSGRLAWPEAGSDFNTKKARKIGKSLSTLTQWLAQLKSSDDGRTP